ncbi:hypothetical protein GO730_02105 [Spirosoma sp. HMF3257]|nr:hypothetical protein [Spirosoma telluris]
MGACSGNRLHLNADGISSLKRALTNEYTDYKELAVALSDYEQEMTQ